jgi:hypothetical protein
VIRSSKFTVAIERQVDRIKRKRLRHSERKLTEALRHRLRSESSISFWSKVIADLKLERTRAVQHRLGCKRTRRGIRFESAAHMYSQAYGQTMIPFTQSEPLTVAELDSLGAEFSQKRSPHSSNGSPVNEESEAAASSAKISEPSHSPA